VEKAGKFRKLLVNKGGKVFQELIIFVDNFSF